MSLNFEKHAQEGNRFINQLAAELDRSEAEANILLRAALHTLRDYISPQESLHFIAQLPLMLKAIYVDGWKIREDNVRVKSYEDFVVLAMSMIPQKQESELDNESEIGDDILTVYRLLAQYVSEGEWNDVLANLPKEVRETIMEEME